VNARPLAALAICAVAGCGGGAKTEDAPAVGSTFAKRAVVICQKALESKKSWPAFPVSNFNPEHPDASALPKVAPWLKQQVAPTFDAWLSGLRGLGNPNTGTQAWSQTISAVARIDKDNRDQAAAAERGDPKRFAAMTTDLGKTQNDLERAASAAGVPSCADVHKG
jgi:hypothetical protein